MRRLLTAWHRLLVALLVAAVGVLVVPVTLQVNSPCTASVATTPVPEKVNVWNAGVVVRPGEMVPVPTMVA